MGKVSRKKNNKVDSINTSTTSITTTITKTKRTRKSVPRDTPPQRSSIYRGVTRHRWTGRYEAHLWDKNCWNETQNKKGRQVYLGAYDGEEAAAHAYDLAALKYWGQNTLLNFPLSTYEDQLKEMECMSKEEYIGSLRRKSSGFSRGVSKYRGVARHHHNGRWEARIGRVFGNKYLYLGTYATQEEAATAYDMAAIEYRGLNAVTNFDLSRYIKWLRPNPNPNNEPNTSHDNEPNPNHRLDIDTSIGGVSSPYIDDNATASSAIGILMKSSKFKEMLENTTTIVDSLQSPPETPPEQKRIFPDDIQTFFDCHDSGGLGDGEEGFFGDLDSFVPPIFHCEM